MLITILIILSYLFLAFLTFFMSFYFEGKEMAKREGQEDPEFNQIGTLLAMCLMGWYMLIPGYLVYKLYKVAAFETRIQKLITALYRRGYGKK